MARTMMEEMVSLLEAQPGANRYSISRYKSLCKSASKGSKPWPCPMCYGRPSQLIGNLKISDSYEGLKNAACDKSSLGLQTCIKE